MRSKEAMLCKAWDNQTITSLYEKTCEFIKITLREKRPYKRAL